MITEHETADFHADKLYSVRNIFTKYFTVHPTSPQPQKATMKLAIFLVAVFLAVTASAEKDQFYI